MLTNRRYPSGTIFLLAIFSIFLNIPNLIWAYWDQSVWPWDPAFYGRVTLALWHTLISQPDNWLSEMLRAFGFKAPMIAWLGQFFVPLSRIFGSIEFSLLILQICCTALSIYLLGYISLTLKSQTTCAKDVIQVLVLLALLASAPLFSGLMNQYFVEHLQLLSVVWMLFVLTQVKSRLLIMLHIVANISFGLLVKISSPLYVALPLLACLILFIQKNENKARRWHTLCCSLVSLPLLIACVSWYYTNWDSIFRFMLQTSSGTVAELYGKKVSFLQAAIEHWVPAVSYSFFLFDELSILILTLVLAALAWKLCSRKSLAPLDLLAFLSLGQIVTTLFTFCLQINRETRYLLPLAPYFYFLILFASNTLHRLFRWIAPVFLLHFVLVKSYQLGMLNNSLQPRSPWLKTVQIDRREKARLTTIVNRTCRLANNQGYQIIASDIPALNADSATFYAHMNLRTFGCLFTSLGHAETNATRACERVKQLNAKAIVIDSSFRPDPGDKFNKVYLEIHNLLRTTPEVISRRMRKFPEIITYSNLEHLTCPKERAD